jgi:hypothetical protein
MLQDFEVMRPRRRLILWRVIWYLVLSAGIGFVLLVGYLGFYLGIEHY